MAEPSFDRTAKRVFVPGLLAISVLAGAGGADAGPWLRQAFTRLLAGGAATATLDLDLHGPDIDTHGGSGPGVVPRQRTSGGRGLRLLGDREAWASGAPAGTSPFMPYAGFGLGAFRLSMNLAEPSLGLSKERKQRALRVFGGLGYALAPNLTTNLEYRALPAGDPAISLDLGGLAFDLDDPFQDHNVGLKVHYRF